MRLRYLTFSADDDGGDRGCWEAMASAAPAHLPEILAEVAELMRWAQAHAPGPRGPEEDGGVWDAHTDRQDEGDWVTVTLTLTGPLPWGEALLARFQPDEA